MVLMQIHTVRILSIEAGEIEQIAASYKVRGVTQLMEQEVLALAEKLQRKRSRKDRTSDEEEKDEWDHGFDFDSEEDTSLVMIHWTKSLKKIKNKNIKIAIVGRPNVSKIDVNQSYF